MNMSFRVHLPIHLLNTSNLHWFHINHACKTLMWCMRKNFLFFFSLFFTSCNSNVTSSPPLTLSLMNPVIILLQPPSTVWHKDLQSCALVFFSRGEVLLLTHKNKQIYLKFASIKTEQAAHYRWRRVKGWAGVGLNVLLSKLNFKMS